MSWLLVGVYPFGPAFQVDNTVPVDVRPIAEKLDVLTYGQAEVYKQVFVQYRQFALAIERERQQHVQIIRDNQQ